MGRLDPGSLGEGKGKHDVFVEQNWELVTKVKLRYSATTRQGGGEISNSYRRSWVAYWSRKLILTVLEGKMRLTCLRCIAHTYSLDRRKGSALYTKPSSPPARP